MTKYEKRIYDIVNASREHMTADQVYGELKKFIPLYLVLRYITI